MTIMATVRINSGNPKYDDRPHTWPKDRWKLLLSQKKQFLEVHIPYDCRCILEFIEDADVMWEPLGYSSRDELIEHGLELNPVDVKMAVEWLKIKDPDFEVPLEIAVTEGRRLAKHGEIGRGRNRSYNVTSKDRGNNKDYLKARIARDFPEKIDAIESGDISTRKAAIECGIIKVKTPLELAMLRYNSLSDADKALFKECQK
jgi:hypothetical protein